MKVPFRGCNVAIEREQKKLVFNLPSVSNFALGLNLWCFHLRDCRRKFLFGCCENVAFVLKSECKDKDNFWGTWTKFPKLFHILFFGNSTTKKNFPVLSILRLSEYRREYTFSMSNVSRIDLSILRLSEYRREYTFSMSNVSRIDLSILSILSIVNFAVLWVQSQACLNFVEL